MSRLFKTIYKTVMIILLTVILLFMLTVLGLNAAKFLIYPDYYARAKAVAKIPGFDDGFVCQGIAASDDADTILVSGYMKDGSASRIYVTDVENKSHYVTLAHGGEPHTGHAGGITVSNGVIYVASSKKINVISLDTVLNAKNGAEVEFEEIIATNNSASYIYSDDKYLYVGEFHDGGKYVTEHPYETPEGMHHAIVSRYSLTDLSKPDMIISVRDKVQGICFTPDGKIVLSTSYGLADSVYYVYSETDLIKSENTLDGCDVYYLSGEPRTIKGPAMAEGLDMRGDKIITLTESASEKYLFGKLFFADNIIAIDYNK